MRESILGPIVVVKRKGEVRPVLSGKGPVGTTLALDRPPKAQESAPMWLVFAVKSWLPQREGCQSAQVSSMR